ncbi:MAG: MBL fold metallo-hydrolase [Candidatus Thorarchaeota archaeon]|nr:MAG: MBL fold metallo-hydrolase [Candidatus Thorarchaeota archaeon]
MTDENYSASWENDEVRVDVPYSVAGVSTTVVVSSKFTGKYLLADVGDGVLRDLLALLGTDFVEEIDMVCITHGHFDHMGGLHSLLGFMRMLGRTSSLDILVPAGCDEVLKMVKSFREVYRPTTKFGIRVQEVRDGVGFDSDFFKINVHDVEHFGLENPDPAKDLLMPAVGYKIQVGETVIAFTGDTRISEGAQNLVLAADLAIIEATRNVAPLAGHRVHLTEEEAKELGSLAKDYILIHRMHEAAKISVD